MKLLDKVKLYLRDWRTFAVGLIILSLVTGVVECRRCTKSAPGPSLQFSTIATQGAPAQTSFAGIVDPTQAAGPASPNPLTACLSSCSGAVADANRLALKATFDFASANRMSVYIPPNEYPVSCTSGQPFGVNITGNNLYVMARGVTFRFTGNLASADCAMFRILASNVWIEGPTYSLRDVTNTTTGTNAIKIGDGGTTTIDTISLIDNQFIDGAGGDYIRFDGGSGAVKVTRVTIERSRFDGSARAGIDVRPGTGLITIVYNFFRNNANRAIWFEDSGAGVIGQSIIKGNAIETDIASPAVTLAGHGGTANMLEQSMFVANRIIAPIAIANGAGGGTLEGTNLARMQIAANTIVTNRSTSAPTIALTGAIENVQIVDNYLDRRAGASSAAVISVIDDGTFGPTNVTIRGNRVKQNSGIAPGIDISGAHRTLVDENKISYHVATADSGATGFMGIYCSGTSVRPCGGLITRNIIRREDQDIYASLNLGTVTANDDSVVQFFRVGTEGNSATLKFVGDAVSTPGSTSGSTYATIVHYRPGFTTVANVETLLNNSIQIKTPGTAGHVLQATVDVFGPTNLAGGVVAGRMRAGIKIVKGTGTTINSLTLRDNFVDGAASILFIDAVGAAQWPEGYALISGNQSVNVSTAFDGGLVDWKTETTQVAEVVASGATSAAKEMTFITTSGTVGYNQPDGLRDGARHCYKVKTATTTPVGTWTPTTAGHFADGTTHSITWNSATDVSWCVVWDLTNTTYRLISKSSGATLN